MNFFVTKEVLPNDEEMLEKIFRLRVLAWEAKLGTKIDQERWCDEWDPGARHWVVLSGRELVAAARLSVHSALADLPDSDYLHGVFLSHIPTPIGSFNRLAANPTFWGRGASKLLDAVRIRAASEMGCASIVVSVPPVRVEQLQRIGFRVVGDASSQRHPILALAGRTIVMLCIATSCG
jgi:hypothetical protein